MKAATLGHLFSVTLPIGTGNYTAVWWRRLIRDPAFNVSLIWRRHSVQGNLALVGSPCPDVFPVVNVTCVVAILEAVFKSIHVILQPSSVFVTCAVSDQHSKCSIMLVFICPEIKFWAPTEKSIFVIKESNLNCKKTTPLLVCKSYLLWLKAPINVSWFYNCSI